MWSLFTKIRITVLRHLHWVLYSKLCISNKKIEFDLKDQNLDHIAHLATSYTLSYDIHIQVEMLMLMVRKKIIIQGLSNYQYFPHFCPLCYDWNSINWTYKNSTFICPWPFFSCQGYTCPLQWFEAKKALLNLNIHLD